MPVEQFREHIDELCGSQKKSSKDIFVRDLIFTAEANPLTFIFEFESAVENSTEEDLKFYLLDFVLEEDEKLFRELYRSSSWSVMRKNFLNVYSTKDTRTKLARMNAAFPSEDFVGLHDYLMYMFEQYSKFTTIQKTDQIVGEVLLRLPPEINELFITREKLFKDKNTILEFCKVLDAEASDLHCSPEATASSQEEPYDPPDEQSDLTSNQSDDQSVDSNESSRPQAASSKGRSRQFLDVPKIRITKPTKGKSKKRTREEDSDEFSSKEGRVKKRTNNTLAPISESEETSSRSNSESSASSSLFRYRTRSRNQIESETTD